MRTHHLPRIFYGWWIVFSTFLNLFFSVGLVFYGFPVFYPSLVESLHFSRQQVTTEMFWGFAAAAPVLGLLGGAVIGRLGAKVAILPGTGFVGGSLFLMGSVTTLRQYYVLCFTEVVGYVLAGPIPNQGLIANWFRARCGVAPWVMRTWAWVWARGVTAPGSPAD